MPKGKLTAKRQRFVEEFQVDLNGTQAAIRAGYSAKTANEQAARLLANVSVQEAVAEAQKARSERVQIDADWVLKKLVEDVEADLTDIFNADGGLYPVGQWPDAFRKGLVAGVEVEEIRGPEGDFLGYTKKIKLSDRLRRLELIGRHLGMFGNNKVTVDVALTGVSEFLLGK